MLNNLFETKIAKNMTIDNTVDAVNQSLKTLAENENEYFLTVLRFSLE